MILVILDMKILYFCVGVEGSAHDSFVYKKSGLDVILKTFSENEFILGDAGYALTKKIITPYRGTRYHLKEFFVSNGPENYKELYNLRHSKIRDEVER